MRAHQGVLICGEILEGRLSSVTRELLGIGQRLADQLGQEVWAALIGSAIPAELAQECIYFGARRVYVVDNPLFRDYLTDSYVAALEKLVRELKPDILLFGQTSMGRDVAPRLAYRLDTGVTLDCIELSIDRETGLMQQTKPVYGGNAHAVYVCQAKPQIASIRPKSMPPAQRDESREGEVILRASDVEASLIRGRLVERVKEEIAGVKLEDADVVVCGGRGIGGREGFEKLEELARLLKGAAGATRPACEDGWAPALSQIGLTGKIVSPKLYLGVALSGSSQHLAGISGSKNIVAINKDPEANIFGVARYGVVGDYRKILAAFTDKCKEGF
jgi:electron transfer flavoprotein alpha subunit